MEPERRQKFQIILEQLIGDPDAVYFQPGEKRSLKRPCIVFEVSDEYVQHANDSFYFGMTGYQVTYIDEDPDSDMPMKLQRLPFSSFRQRFATSGLNHSVYVIYY